MMAVVPQPKLPRFAAALMDAMRFSDANFELLRRLDESEWHKLLDLCDSTQLTLLFGRLAADQAPDWVRARISRDSANNALRFKRLQDAALEIARALDQHSIECVLLKGFAHSPALTPDPLLRSQGDIDLWCPPVDVYRARHVLIELGYHEVGESKGRHLPPMMRETAMHWRGDYFDPALPIPVDLHFELWDQQLERISGPRESDLWDRRLSLDVNGFSFSVLDPADALAFAALHVLMHLLHGDLRLQRAWELAYFLQSQSNQHAFWSRWRSLFAPPVRTLQLTVFRLASLWFHAELPPPLRPDFDSLPDDVALWIEHYGYSPIEGLLIPNKNELWLNLCLVNNRRDQLSVFVRRVLPRPAVQSARGLQVTIAGPAPRRSRRFLNRVRHHLVILPGTGFEGVRWFWLRLRLHPGFLKFLAASVLFDFGEFVFFLLYNLYLLECGFNESFLGQASAALTMGTFLGVLPAAAITRRAGLRNAVLLGILGTAAATALRATLLDRRALLASAFLNGAFMSFWAVSLPPAVAGFTTARNRTTGFSLITSIGIGTGALAGFFGGRLPSLILHAGPSLSSLQSKRIALLTGCAIAATAAIPAVRLRFPASSGHPSAKKNIYPRTPFVYAFLAALFIWSLATSAFNPFFTAYFSRQLHASVQSIGLIFSGAQLAQVAAILLAPLLTSRYGPWTSITGIQLLTGVSLAALAVAAGPTSAAVLYACYMSFQYMTEPCLLNLLMTAVTPIQRGGVSALNFLVIALAGILASACGGAILLRIGYRPYLACCALSIVFAAAAFAGLVRRFRLAATPPSESDVAA